MSQHFLMSKEARGFSLASIARMTDAEAEEVFARVRWGDNDGKPFCPRCGHTHIYTLKESDRVARWSCAACRFRFSVTSETIFSNRKMSLRDTLFAAALFLGQSNGKSMMSLSREMDVQYRTTHALCTKFRTAISAAQGDIQLSGEVQVDGAYFGGHLRPTNWINPNTGKRVYHTAWNNRKVIVVAREAGGRTVTVVCDKESEAAFALRRHIAKGSTIIVDMAFAWSSMEELWEILRVDHHKAYSVESSSTNLAESFHSQMRKMYAHHGHISAKYLPLYAAEMAWRHDYRRVGTVGRLNALIGLCLGARQIYPIQQIDTPTVVPLDFIREVA